MVSDILSITEMAKIRNVTSETLRHYDRIGIYANEARFLVEKNF